MEEIKIVDNAADGASPAEPRYADLPVRESDFEDRLPLAIRKKIAAKKAKQAAQEAKESAKLERYRQNAKKPVYQREARHYRAFNPFSWLKYLVDTVFHVLGHVENFATLLWNAFVLVILVGLVYVLYQKVTGQMLPGGEAVISLYNAIIERLAGVITFIVNKLNG
ncbi:MAG: hypothetical protein K6U04_08655 [Armatimonadetes bacterium]|nr:hypothetical protein [Armatimonadota bacterium]